MPSPIPPFAAGAVVFDLDGVLVDTEGLWARAEQQVTVDLGGLWGPEVQRAMIGRGPADAAAVLARHVGHPDPVEVEARLLEAALAQFAGNVSARAGATSLVHELARRVPLAVATNSRRELAEQSLAAAGFAGTFTAVITADEVPAAKPDPAPYVTACAALGVEPARTVAFEDSPVGARSARAAGCWVVGCPMGDHGDLEAAHVVVDDLAAIDVDALLAGSPRTALSQRGQ